MPPLDLISRACKQPQRYALGWLTAAALLKHWYRDASPAGMQWLLAPLATLLDVVLPGSFEQLATGEWYHRDLGLLLVKSCSGMNFLIMSFLAYGAAKFGSSETTAPASMLHFPKSLFSGLCVAWAISLLANTLRIILAISVVHHPETVRWSELDAEELHRLAGLLVYCPVLFAQIRLSSSHSEARSYWLASGIVILMLIAVPALSGNGFEQGAMFFEHLAWLLTIIMALGLVLAGKAWCQTKSAGGPLRFIKLL